MDNKTEHTAWNVSEIIMCDGPRNAEKYKHLQAVLHITTKVR